MESVDNNRCEICRIISGHDTGLELWKPQPEGQKVTHRDPENPFQRLRWLTSNCESCRKISSALRKQGLDLNDIYVKPTLEFLGPYFESCSITPFLLLDSFDRMLVPWPKPTKIHGPVNSVQPSSIDFEMLRDCINICRQDHDCTNRNPVREENILRLYAIDCSTAKIIRIHPKDPYIALSYVWGTEIPDSVDQITEICHPNQNLRLPSQLPLTIRDAMTVVQKLGRQYLWVDRYCIDQQDNLQRRAAIDNMDQVYARAELVIVALSGDGIECGLPGVSSTPRTACNGCEIDNICIRWTLPSIRSLVRQSSWVRRGWTLQEGLLAQRCLFFTEFQTYLVCGELTRSEIFPYPETTSVMTKMEHHHTLDTVLDPYDWLGAQAIVSQRAAYTLRELTYPADALDAFKGLLRRSGFFSSWGILIKPMKSKLDPHVGFAMGLLWTCSPLSAANNRRDGFPTWSWTSYPGEVATEYSVRDHETMYARFLNCDKTITARAFEPCVRWSMYDSLQRAKVPLYSLISYSQSNLLSERYKVLIAEGETVKVALTSSREAFLLPWTSPDQMKRERCPEMYRTFIDADETTSDNESSRDQLESTQEHHTTEDALILIEWEDGCSAGMTRFMLMLLKWVGPNTAERAGLLNQYSRVIPTKFVQSLPRTKRQFFLV